MFTMDAIYRVLNKQSLVVCVLLLELSNVDCCLPDPGNTAFPQQFMFQAYPSVVVNLGDKLEIKCTANDTSPLSSMALLSRTHKQLNTTCVVLSVAGICSYVVETVQLWHIGKYDCIKIYKNGTCYSKSLIIQKAVYVPAEITTMTVAKGTTKLQPTTEVSTETTTMTASTTQKTVFETDSFVTHSEDKTTLGSGATLSTSLLLVAVLNLATVVMFD